MPRAGRSRLRRRALSAKAVGGRRGCRGRIGRDSAGGLFPRSGWGAVAAWRVQILGTYTHLPMDRATSRARPRCGLRGPQAAGGGGERAWPSWALGPSGAGKSTLTNALLGREAQRTAPVRVSDDRGVHTTSGRELFPLPGGGALVDGPGIRELRLWDASGLDATFEALAAIAARCRFRGCSHEAEPGCAVREAVAEGCIDAARVESHRKLALELARQAERREGGAARAERERWKAVSK